MMDIGVVQSQCTHEQNMGVYIWDENRCICSWYTDACEVVCTRHVVWCVWSD